MVAKQTIGLYRWYDSRSGHPPCADNWQPLFSEWSLCVVGPALCFSCIGPPRRKNSRLGDQERFCIQQAGTLARSRCFQCFWYVNLSRSRWVSSWRMRSEYMIRVFANPLNPEKRDSVKCWVSFIQRNTEILGLQHIESILVIWFISSTSRYNQFRIFSCRFASSVFIQTTQRHKAWLTLCSLPPSFKNLCRKCILHILTQKCNTHVQCTAEPCVWAFKERLYNN